MPTALPVNWLFATLLLQHRFHVVQAIDCRAHLRLIIHCVGIRNLALKIHLHLALFLGDNSLNDGRGLPWIGFSLPGRLIANTFAQALNIGLGSA